MGALQPAAWPPREASPGDHGSLPSLPGMQFDERRNSVLFPWDLLYLWH